MMKVRFFTTLHAARRMKRANKVLRRTLLTAYMKGWTDCYWEVRYGDLSTTEQN